jgi:hypothetical protein
MPDAKPKGSQGLRLTVGGAPNVPHTVPGVPGLYRPDDPVPVGGPGELDVDTAKSIHEDKAVPLELVDVPAKDVDRLREQAEQDRLEARTGLLDDSRSRRLADREKAREQATSIGG